MRRRPGSDAGSASLELIGMLPIVGIVLAALVQAGAGVYALQGTTDAVRQAARAASLGQDVEQAAQRALPGGLTVEDVDVTPGGRVTLSVEGPGLLPTIRRSAELPSTVPGRARP